MMIMRFLILICLSVIVSCSSNNKRTNSTNRNDTPIEVLIHLDPPPLDYYQRHKVAVKYGFRYKHLESINSEEQLDSIDKVNKLAYMKLDKLNGSNWEKRYEIDVVNEYKRDSIIISKIEKLDFINRKDKELAKFGNGLHFIVDTIVGKDTFRVSVESYLDTTNKWVSFFRIYFNYSNSSIDSINKNSLLIHDYSKK